MQKPENAVAVVHQVVVDFININLDAQYAIAWNADDALAACSIDADRNLLKRAIANLIPNSMNHNENGCAIYVSDATDEAHFILCVENNGVGVSDAQIEVLNHAPHYMVCDTNPTEQRHGLGLLIVRQFIDGQNGKVLISHRQYGWFQVTLTFPKHLDMPTI